ncbi:hypothetical protein BT69DRAFT_1212937 [Atractiella rhizophila]|nr:hypothetical protein BT69DRAFT_1212937 [Atractiella rhizophila]
MGGGNKGSIRHRNRFRFLDFTNQPSNAVLRRNLKARHLVMIAIGGTIGTGLFIGTGDALSNGGPLGLLLGYSIMGVVVFNILTALGEIAALYPVSGAFTVYATRFVDPALGFALGWTYFYSYAITLPTELVACALVIRYWTTSINSGVWITVAFIPAFFFNFLGVRFYGELEFWFSVTKITAVVALILLGIILDLGGGPTKDRIGFRYWDDPGPFVQFNEIGGAWGRFLGFWSVFVQAAFSYNGTETVALTVGEAANPRRNVPKAIKGVFFRIALFYIGSVWVIGLLVPSNDENLLLSSGMSDGNASPFVIAVRRAGISGLPSVVNTVILLSAWSAGNSDIYIASRTLYGLATIGMAPKIFRYCTDGGLPVFCILLSAAFGPLAYITLSSGGNSVFGWLYNISSITGLITWWCILLTYLRFYVGLKQRKMDRDTFPYKAPFQPWGTYFSIYFITLVIFLNGFDVFLKGNFNASDFIAAYISLPIFIGFYAFYKLYMKTKFVSIPQMDFDTGRRELEEMMDFEEKMARPKRTRKEKIKEGIKTKTGYFGRFGRALDRLFGDKDEDIHD